MTGLKLPPTEEPSEAPAGTSSAPATAHERGTGGMASAKLAASDSDVISDQRLQGKQLWSEN
eukprot:6568206-Alexandrium_andersonii.AAC.2